MPTLWAPMVNELRIDTEMTNTRQVPEMLLDVAVIVLVFLLLKSQSNEETGLIAAGIAYAAWVRGWTLTGGFRPIKSIAIMAVVLSIAYGASDSGHRLIKNLFVAQEEPAAPEAGSGPHYLDPEYFTDTR